MKVVVASPYSGYSIGSVLDVPDRDGRILLMIGKARPFEELTEEHRAAVAAQRAITRQMRVDRLTAPPAPLVEPDPAPSPTEDQTQSAESSPGQAEGQGQAAAEHAEQPEQPPRSAIRHSLEERAGAFGITVDPNWSDAELRGHVEAARRQRYGRRDMRATE